MAALSFCTTALSSAIVLAARTLRMNCFTVQFHLCQRAVAGLQKTGRKYRSSWWGGLGQAKEVGCDQSRVGDAMIERRPRYFVSVVGSGSPQSTIGNRWLCVDFVASFNAFLSEYGIVKDISQ